jgi:hypothetical protein
MPRSRQNKDKKSTQYKFTTKQTLERDYMNIIFIRLEAYESYCAIMQIVYNYCEYPGAPYQHLSPYLSWLHRSQGQIPLSGCGGGLVLVLALG